MGIYDRDYIRNRDGSGTNTGGGPGPVLVGLHGHPVTGTLLAINAVLFLGFWFVPPAGKQFLLEHFTLESSRTLGQFYLHTLLTSSFFHIHFGHAVINLLLLWVLGRTLEEEPAVGSRNLVWLYVLGALAGSAAFLLVPVPGKALGASDALLALAIVAALAAPHRQVSLFGLVTIPMVGFVVLVVVLSLLPFGTEHDGGIAHFAHLGGLVAGFLYYSLDLRLYRADGTARLAVLRLLQRRKWRPQPGSGGSGLPSVPREISEAQERARMELLLQKISEQGISALSEEERTFLDQASKTYNRRDNR